MCFFAIEDIKSGEELTFDYNWELKAVSKDMFVKSATKCKCGKPKCRVYVNPRMRTISFIMRNASPHMRIFSVLLPVRIRGLPVCIRGPVSGVALTRQRSTAESRMNQNFLVASAHTPTSKNRY